MNKLRSKSIELDGVGLGVYTPTQAARLTGIPASTLHLWLRGNKRQKPLWQSEHTTRADNLLLSFRDLVESRVLHALRTQGFSAQELRSTMTYARSQINDERPFSTKMFSTAGPDIMLNLPDGLVIISKKNRGQNVFEDVVAPVLKPIVYNGDAAAMLWMQKRKKTVALDPKRAFGAPILEEYSIPTATLAASVLSEGSAETTARYFDVPLKYVKDAVAFETNLVA